jgi:hypothetical protein
LEKAIYQVKQAIEKAESGSTDGKNGKTIAELQSLLQDVGQLVQHEPSKSMLPPAVAGAQEGLISHPLVDDNANIVHTHISSHGRSESNVSIESEESLAVDDAENPLQLLARASDLQSPQQPEHASLPTPSAYTHSSSLRDRQEDAIQSFFTSTKVSLDVGEDLDPVHMGLVTLEETESLFKLSVCFLPSMCPSCALANHT